MNSVFIVLMPIAVLFKSFTSYDNHFQFKWTFHRQCITVILHLIDLVCGLSFSVILPNSYSALDGDFSIQVLQNNSTPSTSASYLNLFRLNDTEQQFLERIKLAPDIQLDSNSIHITFGCQHFLYGGQYQLQLLDEIIANNSTQELITYENFYVDWPKVEVNVSEINIPTYPDEDVHVELKFPTGKCRKRKMASANKPEYWLDVVYCGSDAACNSNGTIFHVLYTEQVKYLQNKVLFNLSCDLFGMAGHYAINVRAMTIADKTMLAQTYIHADWNEKFVLNVIDRSIIPCDPYDGIGTLFEYPKCIDFRMRDRIRIFGRLRPDIWALNPPTTLEFIIDHPIEENQHAKYFDCDLFTEKYVEYCFTYVTQAIFGAVAEIRVDCVPTYSLNEDDHGGWSPWSDWTPCSTSCNGGQRHRYRFCNSPMPRYGGRYCEGPSIETKECGNENADKWECLFGISPKQILRMAGNKSVNTNGEAVSKCACGCVAEFSPADEIRVIALSTNGCVDNKLFWLIQANKTQIVRLIMDFVALPCPKQYIKVRDGVSMRSDLLAEYEGMTVNRSNFITSSGPCLLIEFFTDTETKQNSKCNARFLAHAMETDPPLENMQDADIQMEELALIHLVSFTFAALVITLSLVLVVHYMIRYRKYEIAKTMELYSPAHTPNMSTRSLANNDNGPSPPRAISTTTLISEVIYFVKMRRKNDIKHKKLRESTISDQARRLSDPNCSIKQQANRIASVTSHSTQSMYKVISPITVHVDSSSVASFPGYKSKSAKNEDSSKSLSRIIPFSTCGTLKKCKEDQKENNFSSKDLTEVGSNTSSPIKELEADRVLSAGSSITLTSGCYSTPGRAINTATIRTTNQKECKEKENLEKLLSRPQSEFSLGTAEDFEMDYYDYNVLNAADVPGSYLGMDPAYLVWIPPLEEESKFIVDDDNIKKHVTNDYLLSRDDSISCGVDKNSLTLIRDAALSPTPSLITAQKHIEDACYITKGLYQGIVIAEEDGSPKVTLHKNPSNVLNRLDNKLSKDDDQAESEEKETTVVKSPSKGLQSFYDTEDIEFVDD